MSFTSTDLASIEQAIVTLGTGETVVMVTFANGHSVRYREQDLDKLISLRNLIQKETGATHRRVYAKNTGRYTI
jgi:hypothetical protein